MKKGFFALFVLACGISLASCNKCTECELSVQLEGQTQADTKTFSKCGSRKELNEFKDSMDSLAGAYGDQATLTCSDSRN